MKHFTSRITGNREIALDYYELSFFWEPEEMPVPGQFITIKSGAYTSPLLRRPFALSSCCADTRVARIIYQKRGEATALLSAKQKDDAIDMIGPLGNGFPVGPGDREPVLAAGGIGIGPMLYLANSMCDTGHSPLLVFGARNRFQVPDESLSHLRPMISVQICTDDGSLGFHGTVMDYISRNPRTSAVYYTCGPHPMMKAVHEFAVSREEPCWVSMEQVMACGVGACMGCAIATHGEKPYARVCVEGPVFSSTTVVW